MVGPGAVTCDRAPSTTARPPGRASLGDKKRSGGGFQKTCPAQQLSEATGGTVGLWRPPEGQDARRMRAVAPGGESPPPPPAPRPSPAARSARPMGLCMGQEGHGQRTPGQVTSVAPLCSQRTQVQSAAVTDPVSSVHGASSSQHQSPFVGFGCVPRESQLHAERQQAHETRPACRLTEHLLSPLVPEQPSTIQRKTDRFA